MAATDSANVARYKKLVSALFLRRATEGPLPDHEEASITQEHADLWDQIESAELPALEVWIDDQKQAEQGP